MTKKSENFLKHTTLKKCWIVALLDKKEPKSTSYGDYLPKNTCEREVIKRKQRGKDASETFFTVDIRVHGTSFGGF